MNPHDGNFFPVMLSFADLLQQFGQWGEEEGNYLFGRVFVCLGFGFFWLASPYFFFQSM